MGKRVQRRAPLKNAEFLSVFRNTTGSDPSRKNERLSVK
jgi:hypothetical protein